MTTDWLHLRLSAPLMSFGGVSIDQIGPTRDFPSLSAMVGLLANALGWQREEGVLHQALQDRLEYAALIAREGRLLQDIQNAKLEKGDKGWTTWGEAETRAGATYDSPHRRRRAYLADHEVRVVLRLKMAGDPDLDALAWALERPARPLFIGRKPCLPASPLLVGRVQGADALQALRALGRAGRVLWPAPDTVEEAHLHSLTDLADLRNWNSGLHGGSRQVVEGVIEPVGTVSGNRSRDGAA